MTPHIEARKGEIADKVIMPGDPLRAKLVADKYLSDVKIVSTVRGNNVYTGKYKGVLVTVMASGMGMSSMGIYAYELMHFYEVKTLIRVGTCGAYKDMNLFDMILASGSYSETNFALTFGNEKIDIVYPSVSLNEIILTKAKELNFALTCGNVICSEVFDAYMENIDKFFERVPKDFKPIATEMESYALFYLGKKFNCDVACILSVSDVINSHKEATPLEREQGLNKMLELALESIIV